MLDQIT
ncbi:Protein of unknown function [Bacillus cereus]|nr:Protein of unknown function [Bacillus cereus]